MVEDIKSYNAKQTASDRAICERLCTLISTELIDAESKIWHGSPVWFLQGNPIVGYHTLKSCVRLLFWSGQTFEEKELQPEGSFKAAEIRYTKVDEINNDTVRKWLKKAREIQWDYKNIIKRKGTLIRLEIT